MVYFCEFCRCFYFMSGIVWEANIGLCFWFICILLIENQLDVVFLY